MFGISYPGYQQVLPAALRSRYVKALVPIANQQDNFGHH
jgi:predicted acyl esterase